MSSEAKNVPSDLLPPDSLGFLLHDCARLLRKRFEQNARHLGLTRAQWQVLAALARSQGARQAELADRLDVEPITLARILDKLASLGLVERRADPADRRAWRLHLTEKALPLMKAMLPVAAATREEALSGVGESERLLLAKILSAIRGNLTANEGAMGARQEKKRRHG